jgi:hypothetical protein
MEITVAGLLGVEETEDLNDLVYLYMEYLDP